MIECEDPEPNVKHDARVREMYLVVMKRFLQVFCYLFVRFVILYRIIAQHESHNNAN